MYNCDLIRAYVAMSDQAQLICDSLTKKNQLYTYTHS